MAWLRGSGSLVWRDTCSPAASKVPTFLLQQAAGHVYSLRISDWLVEAQRAGMSRGPGRCSRLCPVDYGVRPVLFLALCSGFGGVTGSVSAAGERANVYESYPVESPAFLAESDPCGKGVR